MVPQLREHHVKSQVVQQGGKSRFAAKHVNLADHGQKRSKRKLKVCGL